MGEVQSNNIHQIAFSVNFEPKKTQNKLNQSYDKSTINALEFLQRLDANALTVAQPQNLNEKQIEQINALTPQIKAIESILKKYAVVRFENNKMHLDDLPKDPTKLTEMLEQHPEHLINIESASKHGKIQKILFQNYGVDPNNFEIAENKHGINVVTPMSDEEVQSLNSEIKSVHAAIIELRIIFKNIYHPPENKEKLENNDDSKINKNSQQLTRTTKPPIDKGEMQLKAQLTNMVGLEALDKFINFEGEIDATIARAIFEKIKEGEKEAEEHKKAKQKLNEEKNITYDINEITRNTEDTKASQIKKDQEPPSAAPAA